MRHLINELPECDRCGNPGNSTYSGIQVRDKGSRHKRDFVVCVECQEWAMLLSQKKT